MKITAVIKKPIITEKSHRLVTAGNEYTFQVAKKAGRNLVKKAVEELFGVKVLKVRVINSPEKTKRAGKLRRPVTIAGFKKAMVTLQEGDKIPLFEVEKEKK